MALIWQDSLTVEKKDGGETWTRPRVAAQHHDPPGRAGIFTRLHSVDKEFKNHSLNIETQILSLLWRIIIVIMHQLMSGWCLQQLQEDGRLMDFLFHFVCFPSVQLILAFRLKPNSFHRSRMRLAVGAHVEDTNTSSPALIMCCISCWFSSNHIWALLFASLTGTLKRWQWVSLATVLATQTQSYQKINCNIATTSSARSSDVTACRGRSNVALSDEAVHRLLACNSQACKFVQMSSRCFSLKQMSALDCSKWCLQDRTCKYVKVQFRNSLTMNVYLEPEIRMWLFLRGHYAQRPAVGQWEKHRVGVAYLAAQLSFSWLD